MEGDREPGQEQSPSTWLGFTLPLVLCRLKLENESFVNISYVVVNHQGKPSREKYNLLKSKVSEDIPVYQQEENQPDVWSLLKGSKDDFLIYDRCGRLVQHLGLPYTFLSLPYVEEAIKIAYCGNKCGSCKHQTSIVDEICKKPEEQPKEEKPGEEPSEHHKHNHNRKKEHGHRHHQQEETIVEDTRPSFTEHRVRAHPHRADGQVVDILHIIRPRTRTHHSRVVDQNELGQKVVEGMPQREIIFTPQREADIPVLENKP